MKKKKWLTPLLTVLIKGRPEEMVLSKCRNAEMAGFMASNTTCYKDLESPSIGCDVCWQWIPS